MVMLETYPNRKFNWAPAVVTGDDPRVFMPDFTVKEEAESSSTFVKSKFADLPAFGIWADRTESDDELLQELGNGWRGFAKGQ